ncbi:glutathione peroxidase [Brumimicrobium aurantiacum]|uniref:Glutathione peroxidase n=1 Tax=Brumimicrobium aurantiacum TaxID=1737063 RepID=A0A3E1EYN6_9FLAO|nr:glutathione peroxidase [Brumimicrobium aurantiacum]RFC54680.1 glutathione peroxidase [Brumimicrobium aurantiacum]
MKLYNFDVEDITGKAFDLTSLKGKKVLIVNTASECGLTSQYEELQALYENTPREDFMIIGFPSNDFGAQEPGTNEEVAAFCDKNYGVSFPMMSKVAVKGEEQHPLFSWMLEESKKNGGAEEVAWNFHKFLINENGNFVKELHPKTSPLSSEIKNWINE